MRTENAPAAWGDAASRARLRLEKSDATDCASVELSVDEGGAASLRFVTVSGRRAERALAAPAELLPALEALLVTMSLATPQVASPPAKVAEAPTRAPASAPPAAASLTPSPSPARRPALARFLAGVGVGARLGVAGAYASPAVVARASGTSGAWELGVAGEVDPITSYLPGAAPAGFWLSSFVASARVGRRERFQRFALAYGAGFGVAAVHEGADDASGNYKSIDAAQPRASAHARATIGAGEGLRPCLELAGDVALADLKKNGSLRNDMPELPRWGIVLSVGIEVSP